METIINSNSYAIFSNIQNEINLKLDSNFMSSNYPLNWYKLFGVTCKYHNEDIFLDFFTVQKIINYIKANAQNIEESEGEYVLDIYTDNEYQINLIFR